MAINTPIPDMKTDWQGYSGEQVQAFIKKMIQQSFSDISEKIGFVAYSEGNLIFYDEMGGTEISRVTLTGTSYSVRINPTPSNNTITTLTSETEKIITLAPTTTATSFGSTEPQEFYEDYLIKVERQSGTIWETVYDTSITGGTTCEIDIRNYLPAPTNILRIQVTGATSGQMSTHRYTVTLTDMSLECNHTWANPWLGGTDYLINNIFIFGKIAKTMYVKVGDNDPITKAYGANETYEITPTNISIRSVESSLSTGIVPIEMWLVSTDGLQTKHIKFNIMYVSAQDVGNVSLVCINNKVDTLMNFRQETLLQYAVYNITTITETSIARYGADEVTVANISRTIGGGQVYDVTLDLKVDLAAESGAIYTLELSLGSYYQGNFYIDNSLAFFAEGGYKLYLNTSINSNDSENKTLLFNSASSYDSFDASYEGTWNNFTFADDAWGKDIDGNSALVVKAGSELSVPTLKPFYATGGKVVEFMFRASNISDYDTPILTCMNTETYEPETTKGLIVFPTKVLVMQTGSKPEASIYQQLPLSEDRIHHIAIVEERPYGSTTSGVNLVTIYINGCANVTFSIGGTASFFDSGAPDYNYLRIGQGGTDVYLYMMRIYHKALSAQGVFSNYLNAVIASASTREELRRINDVGTNISYHACRDLKLNCFVVQTKNDSEIPNVKNGNEFSDGVIIRLEYGEHPEWNVTIDNTALDSQGTTSSKYYRHNLRSKVPKTAVWSYPNNPNLSTTGEGYFDGEGNHPMVKKITWKKNIASQPQGHKMGATGLYNDLYKLVMSEYGDIVEEGILPREDARVAVYQHPFVGFHYKASTKTYEFIGMYTGGPDKTDKKTFGYNETEAFPSLMMIEGPDHTPMLTRFLVPWTDDVYYWGDEESLSVGTEKGWDADIAADYDTKKQPTEILALYRSEFKPAYDAIYFHSPYLAYIGESGYSTLESINADIQSFWSSTSHSYEYRNALMTFWEYDATDSTKVNLIYYNVATKQYEILPHTEYDMVSELGITPSSNFGYSNTMFLNARKTLWKERVGEFVNLNEACYRQCFDELIGASDNDAKNSYWRKFKSVADGGKWGFQEDDLDTIFQTDNNGQDTKAYYIEPNDVTSIGNDIFQGRTSAFWYALRIWCQEDLKLMMQTIEEQTMTLADNIGLPKDTSHATMFNVIDHYFWKHSAKYFPTTVYNADTKWAYVDIWYANPTEEYNNVLPLTQVHGDHYETERDWVEKRIAYMFSKYQCGGYGHTKVADGYNILAMTPLQPFTFNVTPAIWQYPRGATGDSVTQDSERTEAGEVYSLTLEGSADGSTTNYVMAIDWLSDLGDLKDLQLAARGGEGAQVSLTVNSERLRRLKVGDANITPTFNAERIALSGDCFETFDARNVSTLGGDLSFTETPRMREIYLSGTNVTNVILPDGGREEIIEMPDTIMTLVLPNINLLKADGLILSSTAKKNLTQIYLENCDNINPIDFLSSLYNINGNSLTHIGLVWRGEATASSYVVIQMLSDIANNSGTDGGYGGVDYNNGVISATKTPNIKGTLYYNGAGVYKQDIDIIKANLLSLNLLLPSITGYYASFEDDLVRSIIATKFGDGVGIFEDRVPLIGAIGTYFKSTAITTFDEFQLFTGVTILSGSTTVNSGAFESCSNLGSIKLPNTLRLISPRVFFNCLRLQNIEIPDSVTSIGERAFYGCTRFTSIEIPNSVTSIGNYTFYGCSNLTSVKFGNSVTRIGDTVFSNNYKLKYVICSAEQVPSLGSSAFNTTNNCPIFVPDASVSAYKAATNWKSYASRIKPLSEFNEADYQ